MRPSRSACFWVTSLAATIPAAAGDDSPKAAGTPQSPAAILERAVLAAGRDPQTVTVRGQIAIALARAGQFDKAFGLAVRIPEQNHREWIYCNISAALAAAGQPDRAIGTAAMLHDHRKTQAAAWFAIIQARAGDLAGGLETIDAVAGRGPDSVMARRWLAWELESKGKFREAVRIFESTGDALDTARALNATARDRLRAGDLDGARQVADETSRVIRSIPPRAGHHRAPVDRAEPEMYRRDLLVTIAERRAAAKDWNGADADIDYILGAYWRVRTMARIAAMRTRAGQHDRAAAMLARALAEMPDGPNQGYLLMEIAEAQTKAGDLDAGRKMFLRARAKIQSHVASNQAYAVARQAEAGDCDGAIQTVTAIPEEVVRNEAYQNIARQLARASQIPRALDIAGKIVAPIDKDLVLLEISEIQLKAGERAAALATLRTIGKPEGGRQPEIVQRMASVRAAAGDVTGALDWAGSQSSPLLQSHALLGVADGMMPDFSCPVAQPRTF